MYFPNHTVQSGRPVPANKSGRPVPANNKATTERFSISTNSLDYVIGTFRMANTTKDVKHNFFIYHVNTSWKNKIFHKKFAHSSFTIEN